MNVRFSTGLEPRRTEFPASFAQDFSDKILRDNTLSLPDYETNLNKMNITINDDNHNVPAGITIADLLLRLEMKSKYVAVERNLELIPRAEHADCVLADGDKLEIVTLVGGG